MSIFTQAGLRRPKRAKFDLSHEKKMSFNMGRLYPILCQEVLPSDSFRVRSEIFMRMAPMLAPIMHRVNVYTHYFFVPTRIIYEDWEDFITGGKDGTLTPNPPYFGFNEANAGFLGKGSLADYLGVPVSDNISVGSSVNVSALPFRAYQQIYNDYFRDQTLQSEIEFSKAGGLVPITDIGLLRDRCWEKDYFTSALPFAQRGPEVSVDADINYSSATRSYKSGSEEASDQGNLSVGSGGAVTAEGDPGVAARLENLESIGITINELRRSSRLQEWLEKNARGGARYVEQILSHFGVTGDDARLQRAEWLGGGKSPVAISEVLQTSGTAEPDNQYTPTPLGEMAGHGITASNINGFKRKFKEHGYVMGIISVLPKTAYQQGLPRMFSRQDKLDYAWPEFAQLGEQEIKNKEVYLDTADSENEGTFGYQSRYAEYKYQCSSVHGDFRDNLDFWHMGRKFASRPGLNAEFVKSDPTKRIFAVEDQGEDALYAQIYNSVSAVRPLPYFNVPQL